MAGKRGAALVGVITLALMLPAGASGATIEVTTHDDELDGASGGKCSLREAVQAANSNSAVGGCPKGNGPSDTITLENGRYKLTIATTNEDSNLNGDLDVDGGKVVFHGEGAGRTDIRTSLADRVVDIHDATPVTFEKIQVRGGDVTSLGTGSTGRGGDIRADEGGVITLNRATVYDGRAYVGGGLYLNGPLGVGGTLKVNRSLFLTNFSSGLGGAFDVVGEVTSKVSKSTIYENRVQDVESSADGGGISNRGDKMTITDTEISGNAAMADTDEAAAGGASQLQRLRAHHPPQPVRIQLGERANGWVLRGRRRSLDRRRHRAGLDHQHHLPQQQRWEARTGRAGRST